MSGLRVRAALSADGPSMAVSTAIRVLEVVASKLHDAWFVVNDQDGLHGDLMLSPKGEGLAPPPSGPGSRTLSSGRRLFGCRRLGCRRSRPPGVWPGCSSWARRCHSSNAAWRFERHCSARQPQVRPASGDVAIQSLWAWPQNANRITRKTTTRMRTVTMRPTIPEAPKARRRPTARRSSRWSGAGHIPSTVGACRHAATTRQPAGAEKAKSASMFISSPTTRSDSQDRLAGSVWQLSTPKLTIGCEGLVNTARRSGVGVARLAGIGYRAKYP